ncbi:High-affinity branched-chain amino acid transport ATP-binding protein LivF [Burkholderiales bacterium]|jgi:branched-chain amino acid transport system ATP-binding protein|nr:MAG: ABC transporter ATP-binding protein [Burkholderiales bacterium]CAG0984735.1 High-affinity branched-chain amino acid transport ATP-binding protein LivF [Burkholderiales bacterium]
MTSLLRVENIDTYYGLIQALRGASLEVQEGGIVAILGANGAGKTTLLKTVMGLLEDQPDKGQIFFDGNAIHGRETEDIARLGIAYVPEGREVFRELTVLENLKIGAYTRREGIAEDLARIFRLFPRLLERRDQWAGTLSGGEQQMLAIGRALMSRPRLLLLDEPSLGLSPLLVQEIFEILKDINADGVTILLVEQNARMALSVAGRALVMERGRFVLDGSAEEVAADPDVQEFYLGLATEESVKGFKRYRRKKRWR